MKIPAIAAVLVSLLALPGCIYVLRVRDAVLPRSAKSYRLAKRKSMTLFSAVRQCIRGSAANWAAAQLAMALLVGGCAGDKLIPIQPALDRPPLVDSLPLTMGVYFGPELSGDEHRVSHPSSESLVFVFPLGPPSVAMFEHVFTGMFEKTMRVDRQSSAARSRADVAAIIETKIERFWSNVPKPVAFQQVETMRIPAEITYRFIVYGVKDEPIASWTVTGSGVHTPRWEAINLQPDQTWLSAAVKLAMRDAAAKFIAGFRDQPQIKEWLQKTGVASGGAQ